MNESEIDEIEKGKYWTIFMSSRDAIMTLEPPSWRFTSGNPATIRMFGAKNEAEFLSYEPWRLSPEKQPDGRLSSEKAKEMIEKAIQEGTNFFEWKHKKVNGEEFFAEVLLSKMATGQTPYLQATVRDISERKKTEQSLEQLNNIIVGSELEKERLKKEILELKKNI
jgi:PAS domain S-box-containing protein